MYTRVSPDELHFDPTNPRFAGAKGNKTDDDIQQVLEREPHIALELVDSFLENGFIEFEPLVVRARPDDGGYYVVEGNRRLAAIRHIRQNKVKYEKKSTKLEDLEQVSVLVFPEGDREQQTKQRVYLGVRHLFGFRDWPAESKAHFLDSEIKTKADVVRTMRELNIKKHELARYLIPYRIRKHASDLMKPHADQDFWVLGEGLNRSGVKEYILLEVDKDTLEVKKVDLKRLKNLLTFVYGTPQKDREDRLIEETRDLSKLGKVLSNPKATAAVEKGKTLEDALVLLDSPEETIKRLGRLMAQTKAVIAVLKTRKDAKNLSASFGTFETTAKKFISDAN
ncbi:MAG TPA: ParB/Srx family N-terminal domain-containing protein [Kofleriaceae bacterium]|nr:ParB/Srx family N-terminal domain-containing protein [Kofleriaceae bacterium]